MSEKPNPPRLIDDPELGKGLRAVRDEAMLPERLAANARSLDAKLTKMPAPGRLPLGTSALTLGAVAAVIVLARLVAGPVLFGGDSLPTLTPTAGAATTPAETATPSLAIATPDSIASIAAIPTPSTAVVVHTEAFVATPVVAVATPALIGGSLADELRIYDEARAFAKNGEHGAALASLDELARRFPKSSLAPEAAITRAEVLVLAGRLDDASALLARLVSEPAHAGRRGELLRSLGDVERARGKCDVATTRYREALAAGASGEEASAARRGLGSCEAGD